MGEEERGGERGEGAGSRVRVEAAQEVTGEGDKEEEEDGGCGGVRLLMVDAPSSIACTCVVSATTGAPQRSGWEVNGSLPFALFYEYDRMSASQLRVRR